MARRQRKREARIHFALHRALMNVIEKTENFDHIQFKKAEPEYPIRGIGRADLVVFDKSGKPWLVIETKSPLKTNDPLNPKVIDQAMKYASWLGAYYFATCDGRTFVLFDNKEKGVSFWERKRLPLYDLTKEASLEAFAEKLLFDIVDLEQGIKKWAPPDEAFVARLKLLHDRLVPLFAESIADAMKEDLKFRNEYKEWLGRQGYRVNDETNEKVSIEAIYLLLNKILFYKVLETKYKGLPKLRIGQLDGSPTHSSFKKRLDRCFKDALKIDYQAVFQNSIYERISMSEELVTSLVEFLDEASSYDLSRIESDVIGRIYEGLIPIEERRHLGQYYTPPAICDLIVRMCVTKGSDFVLDPGCGTGGFLIKAYHRLLRLKGKRRTTDNMHLQILGQLWGVDISQFPAHLSVINLAMRHIQGKSDVINVIPSDFFKILPRQVTFKKIETETLSGVRGRYEVLPLYDAIICNPPYTRHDDIGDKRYREYIRRVALSFNGERVNISSEAGIYAYFFTHSAHFLKQKGMFGYIVSNSWLDAKFGLAIQHFFLDNFQIKAILEFDKRAFADAAINTIILIARKLSGDSYRKQRDSNTIKFVRLKSHLSTEKIVRLTKNSKKSYESEKIRVTLKKQGDLYEDSKWMKYLHAPPIFFKLSNDQRVCKLSDVASVNVGIITYANDFFVVSSKKEDRWRIEEKYLRPVLASTRDIKMVDIQRKDIKNYIFCTDKPKSRLKNTKALKYIRHGENKRIKITRGSRKGEVVTGYQNIPSFKGRRQHWYRMKPRRPAPIIVPDLMWERNFAAWNRAGVLAIHAFYEVVPDDDSETLTLLGILNSSLVALFEEVLGRTALGEGAIRMMAYEWLNLLIPDPREMTLRKKKKIRSKFIGLVKAMRSGKSQKIKKARIDLDNAVFDALSVSQQDIGLVYESIVELKERRKRKVEAEVLIEHPETKKKRRVRKGLRKERADLTKWFV